MKLKELKGIMYSPNGWIQCAIVYDLVANKILENGCSIEYAIENYGEKEIKNIQADEDCLVLKI